METYSLDEKGEVYLADTWIEQDHVLGSHEPNKGNKMNVLNDNVPADVPLQALEVTDVKHFIVKKDAEGNEIRIPVEGPVSTVQDREFSDDAAGN